MSGDVVDFLCTDRKGVLCLPDVECSYLPSFTNGEYMQSDERSLLISFLENDQPTIWPRNLTCFTFKNTNKYFGSPLFDGVLNGDFGTKNHGSLVELVESLRTAF